ncbi:LLM class flavin-dependent oxidoreductase [Pleomorphovibrio marinus]|uniref:LLM class flavin-dependent oxidoreductase n=1 Tax=Pleomorphovibrio marinus TaxID=2164132 RepID=UPI000E0A3E89|nr:LLM class flavin-dependent oxidoreductase [Pleomorphovibrio marinus]
MKDESTIPYSFLDLAILKEDEDHSSAFRRCVNIAQHVESLGYNRFWVAEHHNMAAVGSVAPIVLMSHIAHQTHRIRVGAGGIMLPNHSPLMVAEQIGTLERLYPGRIDLGLGRAPGTDQKTASILRRGRMETVQEFPEDLEELKAYFLEYEEGRGVRAFPAEGLKVPMYLLGSSMSSARLSAQLGMPYVFASHFAPTYFLEAMSYYRKNFRSSESCSHPYGIACINVIVAASEEKANYLATSFLQMALGILRGKSYPLRAPVNDMDKVWSPEEAFALQRMLSYSYIGTAASVKKGIRELISSTGINEVMITTNIYEESDRKESLALTAEVMNEINLVEG